MKTGLVLCLMAAAAVIAGGFDVHRGLGWMMIGVVLAFLGHGYLKSARAERAALTDSETVIDGAARETEEIIDRVRSSDLGQRLREKGPNG